MAIKTSYHISFSPPPTLQNCVAIHYQTCLDALNLIPIHRKYLFAIEQFANPDTQQWDVSIIAIITAAIFRESMCLSTRARKLNARLTAISIWDQFIYCWGTSNSLMCVQRAQKIRSWPEKSFTCKYFLLYRQLESHLIFIEHLSWF